MMERDAPAKRLAAAMEALTTSVSPLRRPNIVLSRAARMPTQADIPSLASSLIQQAKLALGTLDILALEAPFYRTLAVDLHGLLQLVETWSGLVEIARALALPSDVAKAVAKLSDAIEQQVRPASETAEAFADALERSIADSAQLSAALRHTIAYAAFPPTQLPGILLGLHKLVNHEPLASMASGSTMQGWIFEQNAAIWRAIVVLDMLLEWAALLRAWNQTLAAYQNDVGQVFSTCLVVLEDIARIGPQQLALLDHVGAASEHVLSIVTAVQTVIEAVGWQPHANERQFSHGALHELLEAATAATQGAKALPAIHQGLTQANEAIRICWSPATAHSAEAIEHYLTRAAELSARISRTLDTPLLTQWLSAPPPPSVPTPPPAQPVPATEPGFPAPGLPVIITAPPDNPGWFPRMLGHLRSWFS